ncbi:MAG: hypothetical protein U0075_16650 [Thermomicrobiales bacterium]
MGAQGGGLDAAAVEDKGATVGEATAGLHVDWGGNFSADGHGLAVALVGLGRERVGEERARVGMAWVGDDLLGRANSTNIPRYMTKMRSAM